MSTITRREFSKKITKGFVGATVVGSGLLPLENFAKQNSAGKKPNFVFVCSDQHNPFYTGFGGHKFVQTPNMDKLAKGGVVFSSTYCGSPLCAPGRASLITGMYPSDVNSFCNSTVYDGSYPTWGKRLKDSGYKCWSVGKQDLNPDVDLGFVEVNVSHGHAEKPDITSLFRRPVGYRIAEREGVNGERREENHHDEEVAKKAINYIRNESNKLGEPWAVFIGLLEPHPAWSGKKKYFDYYLSKVEAPEISIEELEQLPLPYQVMRNFKRISTPIPVEKIKRAMAAYFSMITELDGYIGEIYNALVESGQIDNTYFIYTSDHGESLGSHGMWLKNNLYEGIVTVPLIVTGPDLPKGKVVEAPVGHVDLAATILELSGVGIPKTLRGKSLMPLMQDKSELGPQFAYSESLSEGNPTGSFMIRKGDWKYIHFSYYDDYLFNIKEDRQEKINRINDPAVQEIVNDLKRLMHQQVNPEELTEKAFAAQEKMLNDFAEKMNEEELFNLFKSRLGNGQARVMAKMLKKKNTAAK
jgi:choline-sulfatase